MIFYLCTSPNISLTMDSTIKVIWEEEDRSCRVWQLFLSLSPLSNERFGFVDDVTLAKLSEWLPQRQTLGSFASSLKGCALMEVHAGRHSPAHSGCRCPSGPGSGPAVTSSLSLCCRWCRSSRGHPAFCWPGTSPLSPLPGKWDAAAYSTKRKNSIAVSIVFH